MGWMKAEVAENVARMLKLATSGVRFRGYLDGSSALSVVRFEIIDPVFEALKE
jgi:hypothetical protein